MTFEAVIGLEIHVEMKTKSKMFSSSPNAFSHEPNTEVAVFDMAFPGSMPVVNRQAVINAIRVAHALHMNIDHLVRFDRKNYFYADLPKGYQITQQFHPLGSDGYLDILDKEGHPKRVSIERIHMEEDTAKQLHFDTYSLLDYNRAGVPLVEIVFRPELRNGTEAMRCVEAIRNIVIYSGTSDGKMEEGSLRCDVNISLRPFGEEKLGTRVEIKNLNSTKNIEAALDYEIARQTSSLLAGVPIRKETRRYDEASGKTIAMRAKTEEVDYKYFPEPNIFPIRLSDEFVENAISSCPELYDEKLARYLKLGLSEKDAEIILSDFAMSCYFDEAVEGRTSGKTVANFLIVEVNGYLNKTGIKITEFACTPKTLSTIADYQDEGLTHKQCVDILRYCVEQNVSAEEAKQSLGIEKHSDDETTILGYIRIVLDENPQSIADYKKGKDRAIGFLIGQVVKLAKGNVNPASVARLMNEELKKR